MGEDTTDYGCLVGVAFIVVSADSGEEKVMSMLESVSFDVL